MLNNYEGYEVIGWEAINGGPELSYGGSTAMPAHNVIYKVILGAESGGGGFPGWPW
jgi:hypothetical protein